MDNMAKKNCLIIIISTLLIILGCYSYYRISEDAYVVRTFSNGRKLYYDKRGGHNPYYLEGEPETTWSSSVVFVDNDEALKEQQLLSQLNGEVFVDVRDGWSKSGCYCF